MFTSTEATPLRDRIAAALAERGLDPDDPFAGDDQPWAPEDPDQPHRGAPEVILGLIRRAEPRQ